MSELATWLLMLMMILCFGIFTTLTEARGRVALYERLGGQMGVKITLDQLSARTMVSDSLKRQLADILEGRQTAELALPATEFNHLVDHLWATLNQLQVADREKSETLALLQARHKEVTPVSFQKAA